jgi:hypothetical protein
VKHENSRGAHRSLRWVVVAVAAVEAVPRRGAAAALEQELRRIFQTND